MQDDHYTTLFKEAQTHYVRGDFEEAQKNFEELARLYPTSSEAHLNLGNIHFQHDKPNDAMKHWEKALELDPLETNVYMNLGNLHFKLNNTQRAVHYWEIYRKLNKNNATVFLNLGIAYDKLNNPGEALHNYSIYIGLDPASKETNQLRYRFQKAKEAFEHNIRIAEKHLKTGNLKGAQTAFSQSLTSYPGTPKIYKTYGNLLYKLGDLKEALHNYMQAYEGSIQYKQPLDPTVLTNMGVIYEKMQRWIDACWAYYTAKSLASTEQNKIATRFATVFESHKAEMVNYIEETRSLYLQKKYKDAMLQANRLMALRSLLGPLASKVEELHEQIEEIVDPNTQAAKTYPSHGDDARANGRLDQALQFYQKYLVLKPTGMKASEVRSHMNEINKTMGAVVNSLIASDPKS